MEFLIAFGLPLLIGGFVFEFFRRDLEHFREARKLKVGELEALLKRHRLAIGLHLALLFFLLYVMIFFLQNLALLGAILLAGVFLGHVSALARFSRPLIASLHLRNEYLGRLQDEDLAEDSAGIEEEIKQEMDDGADF